MFTDTHLHMNTHHSWGDTDTAHQKCHHGMSDVAIYTNFVDFRWSFTDRKFSGIDLVNQKNDEMI